MRADKRCEGTGFDFLIASARMSTKQVEYSICPASYVADVDFQVRSDVSSTPR